MADATGKKLLGLLSSNHPASVRCAAAVVLGEIGIKDKDVGDALCLALDDPEPALRAEAVAAIGKLKVEKALPQLLEHVKAGGPESEAAAQMAARLGPRGIKALQELMHAVAPGLRRRIASALGAGGSLSAETAAVDALLDSDPGVVSAAVRTLMEQLPSLKEGQRAAVGNHVLELLNAKKGPRLAAASEVALVRLLAALGDPRGESIFWAMAEPQHPADLRAAALQALGALGPPSGAVALKRLFAAATDADFRVAAPALMLLKSIPVSARTLKDWLPLLSAPDVAARRFGIEKLGGQDTKEVAAGLVKQLQHQDRNLRDLAVSTLMKLEHGRAALTEELLAAENADQAWSLARAQAPLARDYAPALRSKLFAQAARHLEADDRRADALLFLLREGDARDVRDRLEERAVALRKKKKYDQALHYLRLLARDPACGEAMRFEQAGCGLKTSAKDLAAEARAADPCLHHFARLIHSHETDPLVHLQKAAWLEPEDLFYLGFHFAEGKGPERVFAGGVLNLLLKKSPKSKLAKDARSKLNSAGLS